MKKKRGISSREMIKMIEKDGWYLVATEGDHYQYKHSTKKGRVTVRHPVKDLSPRDVNSILNQSGLK